MKRKLNFRTLKIWSLIFGKVLYRNKVSIALSVLALMLLFFAQLKFNLFHNPNLITLGFIGTYQEHDLPLEVTKLISSGLVEPREDGHLTGKLVSGWETNHDATLFKFRLKENLKWIDGEEIKSGDFDIAIPNTEITTPNERTLQFKLKESYSPLPSLLTKPVFKKGTLIGTGPYQIVKIEKSRIFITKIELKSKNPNLPLISVRFYPNESVAITGFNLGEVQALFGFSNTKAFSNNRNVILKRNVDYTGIVTILFNTKDNLLSNRSFRQALAYAAPQIEGEKVANNPYPPTMWAFDPDAKKYLSNPQEAKDALGRAKATMSEELIKGELILTSTPNLDDVGEKVVKAWKDLGINAKLRIESGIAQNFQALLITQSIPLDPDQYFLWHTTQSKTNLTKYDSKRADKDLEDGRKTITEEDRKMKYNDFQRTLLEDSPAVFLYFPQYNIAYIKKSEKLLNRILNL